MFKIIFSFIVLQLGMLTNIYAGDLHDQSSHDHSHVDVDGSKTKIDPVKYNNFVRDLSGGQVAIVDVKGMVCDFCARGIEKTFYDDKEVKKVSVDLRSGKVLVAYSDNKKIDIDEIKNIFLINGQTATNVTVDQL